MNNDDNTSAPGATHLSDMPTAVSLGNELDTLRDAIQGARLIADLHRHDLASDDEDAVLAPHACSAVLSLVECRLRLGASARGRFLNRASGAGDYGVGPGRPDTDAHTSSGSWSRAQEQCDVAADCCDANNACINNFCAIAGPS